MSKIKNAGRPQNGETGESKAERAARVVNKIGEDAALNLSGKMLAAVELEAGVIEAAENQKAEASGNAWAIVRDTAHDALNEYGHEGLALVLERFKDRAALQGDKVKARSRQYAALLNRAATAAKADKAVPAKLWQASRTDWAEHAFWRDAGIMSNKGRKAANGTGKTAHTTGEGGESVGEAATAATKDKELSEVMELVAGLKGPFRKEWMKGAKELALAISSRQTQASGGSR
jgi:hypothetical protein